MKTFDRKKNISKLLQKKECKEVLDGSRFEWDYKQRRKIIELENVVWKMKQKQSDLTGDYDAYMQMQGRIDKVKGSINRIENSLDENLKWELLVASLVLEVNL